MHCHFYIHFLLDIVQLHTVLRYTCATCTHLHLRKRILAEDNIWPSSRRCIYLLPLSFHLHLHICKMTDELPFMEYLQFRNSFHQLFAFIFLFMSICYFLHHDIILKENPITKQICMCQHTSRVIMYLSASGLQTDVYVMCK